MASASAEEIKRHLTVETNHEAGLIPTATVILLRKLLAEQRESETSVVELALRRNQYLEASLRKRWPDWRVSPDEMLAVLLLGEQVGMTEVNPESTPEVNYELFGICVLEYDFFGPSYTAYIPITRENMIDLYGFYEKDQSYGREAWLCKLYQYVPRESLRKRIEAGGVWNCAAIVAQAKLAKTEGANGQNTP